MGFSSWRSHYHFFPRVFQRSAYSTDVVKVSITLLYPDFKIYAADNRELFQLHGSKSIPLDSNDGVIYLFMGEMTSETGAVEAYSVSKF